MDLWCFPPDFPAPLSFFKPTPPPMNFVSIKFLAYLSDHFGPSAAKTYSFLRLRGKPASACLSATRRQVQCIGREYDGVLYALPFRGLRY